MPATFHIEECWHQKPLQPPKVTTVALADVSCLVLCLIDACITYLYNTITKLPESGVLCDNITAFGVAEDHLSPVIFRHPKQSDIATQHTRRRLFCVYAMLFI